MIPVEKLYLATIAEEAAQLAKQYGTGLEIDAFCTAANMEGDALAKWDALARQQLEVAGEGPHIFHAPFAELSPAAIDPRVLAVVRERFAQAYALAVQYGIRRMVVHAGYIPRVYFPEWFIERSILFWKEFLLDKPEDFSLLIENVLEDDPSVLAAIIEGIGDARARLCLDVGHAFCASKTPLEDWIDRLAPYIGHVHLHNNDGTWDAHAAWDEGGIPMRKIIKMLRAKAPDATYTLEMQDPVSSVQALTMDEPDDDDAPREVLKRVFGYDDFREGQRQLIDAQITGQDVLGVMPTGAGKSVCYQVPALLSDGVSLVVSPLISLMKDQVSALRQAGVDAAFLNSSLTERQFDLAMRNADEGKYKLIYVAPERLMTPRFLSFAKRGNIRHVAVDEAHCISQWGQDFRPSYLDIPAFIAALPFRPTLSAFTATATPEVKADIIRLLALRNPVQVQTGFDRPNLYYAVQRPKNKRDAVLALLAKYEGMSGIVYCATRKNVEEVCTLLRAHGIPATRYHAGLSDDERHRNQEDFTFDRAPVIVATNAFGMGIDKSNVRFIIHYNMPKDVESYYQEAGRAGRDGERAECVLLYNAQDAAIQRYLIGLEDEERENVDPVLRKQVQENAYKRLQDMVLYGRTQKCLRQYILRYFGEPAGMPCDNCSSCDSTVPAQDVSELALPILRGVRATGSRFGLATVLRMLRGSKDKRITQFGLDKSPLFGSLKTTPMATLQGIGEQLLAEGYLEATDGQYPIAKLGPLAQGALSEEEPVLLTIPHTSEAPALSKPAKASSRGASPAGIAPANPALFEALRSLRLRLATQQGVPAFIIFTDATLRDMSAKKPQTMAEMRAVKGIGESKLALYGEEFLEAVRSFNE